MADTATVAQVLLQVEQLSRDIGQDGWIQASLVPTLCRVELHKCIDQGYLVGKMASAQVWIAEDDGRQRRATTPGQRRLKRALQSEGRDPGTWMPSRQKVQLVKLTERGIQLAAAYAAASRRPPMPDSLPLASILAALKRRRAETAEEYGRRQRALARTLQRRVRSVSRGVYPLGYVLLHCGELDTAKLCRAT